MSLDLVDDLEAAEDRIGMLEAAMRAIASCDCGHAETAKAALGLHGPWCRPSCDDHDHADPEVDCGCPAHEEAGAAEIWILGTIAWAALLAGVLWASSLAGWWKPLAAVALAIAAGATVAGLEELAERRLRPRGGCSYICLHPGCGTEIRGIPEPWIAAELGRRHQATDHGHEASRGS